MVSIVSGRLWSVCEVVVVIFGYDNDLAIVSHTLFGLRQIIESCEEYASEMDFLLNPKKV